MSEALCRLVRLREAHEMRAIQCTIMMSGKEFCGAMSDRGIADFRRADPVSANRSRCRADQKPSTVSGGAPTLRVEQWHRMRRSCAG